jgi:hypothetical protein
MTTPRSRAIEDVGSDASRAGLGAVLDCNNTPRSDTSRVTLNGVCAWITALVASSLTTSATSSLRYRRCGSRAVIERSRGARDALLASAGNRMS